MKTDYCIKQIKEICRKGSSNVAQKDLIGNDGEYPIYGASGLIKKVNFYQQDDPCIGLVKDGSIGKVFLLPPKSSVISTMQYIFPNEGYSLNYLLYCLQSLDFSKYKVGSVIPHIYFRDYGEEKVRIACNISEQNKIVDFLNSEFQRIDIVKNNAERNLKNAQNLFYSLCEKTFSEIDAPSVSVSSIAKVTSGYAFKSSSFKPSGKYQVIRIGNVKQNQLRLSSSPVFIDEQNESVLSKSVLKVGDIVVTQTGTKHKMDYGFVALVTTDGLLLNQRVARIRFTSEISVAKWFLYYSFTNAYKKQFFAHEGGTVGQGNVGIGALTGMCFPLPDNDSINSAIMVLDRLNDKCRTLQEEYVQTIALCDELKQSLLKKAFKGEL